MGAGFSTTEILAITHTVKCRSHINAKINYQLSLRSKGTNISNISRWECQNKIINLLVFHKFCILFRLLKKKTKTTNQQQNSLLAQTGLYGCQISTCRVKRLGKLRASCKIKRISRTFTFRGYFHPHYNVKYILWN